MGVVCLPTKRDYWRNDDVWPYHPLMHDLDMTWDRFSFMWRHFHLTDVDMAGVEMEEAEEVYGQHHHGGEDLVMMEPVQTHTYQNGKLILYCT